MRTHVTSNKRFFIFLACCLCFLILLYGYLYFRYEQNSIRRDQYENLKAIAELKINQITQWQLERLADANTIFLSSFFEKGIEQLVFNGHNKEIKDEFIEQLSSLEKTSGYKNIFITTPSGDIIFSLDSTLKINDSIARHFISESAIHQKINVTYLYHCPRYNTIYYDLDR